MISMDFDNGKYTAIYDSGKLIALRYGEQWRDLTGDNLFYWMLVTAEKLEQQNTEMLALLKEARDSIDSLPGYPKGADTCDKIDEFIANLKD